MVKSTVKLDVWHVLTKRPVEPQETEYRAKSGAAAKHACALLWGVGPSRLRAHRIADCTEACVTGRAFHDDACAARVNGPCICGLTAYDVVVEKVSNVMVAHVVVLAKNEAAAKVRAEKLVAASDAEMLGPVDDEANPTEGCMALLPGEEVDDWDGGEPDSDAKATMVTEHIS
jgi:hypothetical protein